MSCMKSEESRYFGDWFRIGAKEIERAKRLLEDGDLDAAGFNIQQAVEKYIKGYLLSKGWELRRIHNLDILLNDAMDYEPSLDEYRQDCIKITHYYVEDRYPFTVASELTKEEIKESLQVAKKLIKKIVSLTEE
ncbi:MAG: HEPN domain-containing protein [candidate division Zixibacteria bacterium]|nr:HEPN domain-containing protein [candidate division Zixibacteria bacterium]